MTTAYRKKLLNEIEAIPERLVPRFYRIIHTLRVEMIDRSEETKHSRGSLRGLWKGSTINEALIAEAKKSLFSYHSQEENQ